ncbi:MAG TPA: HNH endonuclease [Mucilaginibacter sp.]|jgi:5-methylcytosine-specific restriction endonuclease McrA
MKYQLNDFNRNVPDIELLDDLKRVAEKLGTSEISSRGYDGNEGKYTSGTISARFGGWNNALKKAGLKLTLKHNPSEMELFRNIEEVWINLGRQPVFRDLKRPLSEFSPAPYISKFGTFRRALEAFVDFINYDNVNDPDIEKIEENSTESTQIDEIVYKHITKRFPSERLKVQVLMRDGNTCRLCGVTLTGDNIHFDHILPWSKGGETVLENLQILCAIQNLAKGNLYDIK